MRSPRLACIAGLCAVALIALWLASRSGPFMPAMGLELLWVLVVALPPVVLWLLSAAGIGTLLRRWLAPAPAAPLAVTMGLGVAAMLWIDTTLGRLGVLDAGGGAVAWLIVIAGTALAIAQAVRRMRSAGAEPARPLPPAIAWTAAPALAALLVAACSAPGWLWSSEFGGYDAMSYHLMLPKQWLEIGRIAGLEHNVYSFLPGYVEAAYFHLAAMRGDALAAAYSAQLLHAAIAVLAAAATGSVAKRLAGDAAGPAAVIVLATPWVVVTGSLAYNEMAVGLLLASALAVIESPPLDAARRGAAVGLLTGAACGAKLTAVGFVALPLGVLLLATSAPRRWPMLAGAGCAAGLLALSPWLLANAIATGNPVFPFACGSFGHGHWTAEQAAFWSAGHHGGLGPGAALTELWHQVMRFGIGPSPYASAAEPWLPQWSILPWTALAALIAGLFVASTRRWSLRLGAILLLQVLFWLGFTHLKSRFMLLAVVPSALLVAIVGARVLPAGRARGVIATALLLASAALPAVLLARERSSAPAAYIGQIDLVSGAALTPAQRRELARSSPPVYVRYELPGDARVLLVGEAAPLYYPGTITWQTTWDRGPLSSAIRAAPDDPAAWIDELRGAGFTHVLVRPEMLEIWQREGWLDPMLDPAALRDALEENATLLRRFEGGITVWSLSARES